MSTAHLQRRDVPLTWARGTGPHDVAHIIRRGHRSYCGAVSLHRGGWAVIMPGALDTLAWEAIQTRAPNALCAYCCRLARVAGAVPGVT